MTNDSARLIEAGTTGEHSVPRRGDQGRCPLLRGALRTGDPRVFLVVMRLHPPRFCAAARRAARYG